jgi:hypothetical protein
MESRRAPKLRRRRRRLKEILSGLVQGDVFSFEDVPQSESVFMNGKVMDLKMGARILFIHYQFQSEGIIFGGTFKILLLNFRFEQT